ncbi:MAG TPA: MFS transporter [Clostridia bacterium]|nr:MFS transporter [Clostridia bacterium]
METAVRTGHANWQKQVTLFLISQNLSIFGSSVVSYAIMWHITLETSSGTWMMWFTICSLLPQVVVSLWGGVWADRYNRKYLAMVPDALAALATLGLAVAFWAGYRSLLLLLVASFVRSVTQGIQAPAVLALYPQLVPVDRLTRVQGVNMTLNSILMLLAPAAGGVILGSLGIVWTFMVDVVTASLAVLVLSFIRVEKVRQSGTASSVLAELKEGVLYAFRDRLLKSVLICYGVTFFLVTPAAMLTPLLVERVFGGDVWKLTANEIAWTVGTLIGGVFVSLKGQFRAKIPTVALGLVIHGFCFTLLGLARDFAFYLTAMGIAGFFMPMVSTAQTVLLQENVEQEMMGRVFSLVQIVSGLAMPVAILFFGPLADQVSIGSILVVTGVLLAVTGVLYRLVSHHLGLHY